MQNDFCNEADPGEHEASNRLFLTSLVHGRHRPILDLLPSLLYREQQLVHVPQEKRKRPDLPVAEGVCECYAVVKREYDRLLPRRTPLATLACTQSRSMIRAAF